MKKYTTPILYRVYNRPEITRKSFSIIQALQPQILYIFADGPRNNSVDQNNCKEVHNIVKNISWNAQVKFKFLQNNIGPRYAAANAIDWFFLHEKKGVILEDDVLSDMSFFPFCTELLNRYENDSRVMHISGNNFQFRSSESNYSYYFTSIPHVWGWATWKRAWKYNDVDIKNWRLLKKSDLLSSVFRNRFTEIFWTHEFDKVYSKYFSTSWDYQWFLAIWAQHGLNIMPNVNLVKHIGYGSSATHTREYPAHFIPQHKKMRFPLIHPPMMFPDFNADYFAQRLNFRPSNDPPGLLNKNKDWIKKRLLQFLYPYF